MPNKLFHVLGLQQQKIIHYLDFYVYITNSHLVRGSTFHIIRKTGEIEFNKTLKVLLIFFCYLLDIYHEFISSNSVIMKSIKTGLGYLPPIYK